ncbi:DUF6882 domain-containing protein [Litorihabitans aurantiacus]|uniref:Uncharacterized protein n=1 Tax=Litorihabitans aurantiacus TaxID=1930061 RepID=A0AA38CUB1_9MICO|nr:DUF6882 domain-containing protein [Litorihabitans aurantiacus]GMA32005.1 hypothetical protein GCM10025875_19970 [Litorihabitans aurantiacus]
MQRSPGLTALVDDSALLAQEAQLHLTDLHGGHARWGVDLAAGTFSFTSQPDDGEGASVSYPVQLIGSAAPGPRSWLWGWANPSGYSPQVLRAAEAARTLGETYGIPELTAGEVPFDPEGDTAGADADGEQVTPGARLAWDLTRAAAIASNTWFAYSGEVSGGTRVMMLLEGLTLPAASFPRVTRLISEALASGVLTDHRRAVSSYATLRDLGWDGSHLVLPDGALTITFDDAGRITNMQGSTGAAGPSGSVTPAP